MSASRSKSGNKSSEYKRIAAYYVIPDVSNRRKLFCLLSEISSDYLASNDKRDYDEIIPRLFLGRIPCEDGFSLPSSIGMVVSVIAYQEMAGKGLFKSVIKPENWKQKNVEYVHIIMKDMTADASREDMLDACKKIKTFLEDPENNNKCVYVHCKAGRSRSALLVTLFLAMYGYVPGVKLTGDPKGDFDAAYQYIQSKRRHVDVDEEKAAFGYHVLSMIGSNDNKNIADDSSYATIDEYVGSLKAKDNIRQMTSFRALAEYATEIQYYFVQCQRTNHVRKFFQDILDSEDGTWLKRLVNREGAIKDLLDANPVSYNGENYANEDKVRREKLVSNFADELNAHLVSMKLSVVSLKK